MLDWKKVKLAKALRFPCGSIPVHSYERWPKQLTEAENKRKGLTSNLKLPLLVECLSKWTEQYHLAKGNMLVDDHDLGCREGPLFGD